MSNPETTTIEPTEDTTSTEAEPTEPSLVQKIREGLNFGDESRFTVEPEVLVEQVTDGVKLAASAARAITRSTETIKAYASWSLVILAEIMLPSGFPDWGAKSARWSAIKQEVEDKSFAKVSDPVDRRRLNQNVRKHRERTYTMRAVVEYILAHENASGSYSKDAERMAAEDNPETGILAVISDPSDNLKRRVNQHYDASGLKVPADSAFYTGATLPSPGPDVDDPGKGTEERLAAQAGFLSQISPDYGSLGLLQEVSAFALSLRQKVAGEIPHRPLVTDYMRRVELIARTCAKALDGNVTPEDWDSLAGILFVPDADAIPTT